MIDVIIITITLFLQWISNNFKVKITVWPENSIALLSISCSAASFWKSCLLQKSKYVRNMSLYYSYYLKKMPHWKPFFILTYLGSIQENEFHHSY